MDEGAHFFWRFGFAIRWRKGAHWFDARRLPVEIVARAYVVRAWPLIVALDLGGR